MGEARGRPDSLQADAGSFWHDRRGRAHGGLCPCFPISGGDVETFDKVITINLRGTFLVLGQAAKHVPQAPHHRFIKQRHCLNPFRNYGPYIASKAAWKALVRVLAK